jgi:hypothetical protein
MGACMAKGVAVHDAGVQTDELSETQTQRMPAPTRTPTDADRSKCADGRCNGKGSGVCGKGNGVSNSNSNATLERWVRLFDQAQIRLSKSSSVDLIHPHGGRMQGQGQGRGHGMVLGTAQGGAPAHLHRCRRAQTALDGMSGRVQRQQHAFFEPVLVVVAQRSKHYTSQRSTMSTALQRIEESSEHNRARSAQHYNASQSREASSSTAQHSTAYNASQTRAEHYYYNIEDEESHTDTHWVFRICTGSWTARLPHSSKKGFRVRQ